MLQPGWVPFQTIRVKYYWKNSWSSAGISQKAFAKHLGIPMQRINEIVRGKCYVTPDTAWLLAQAFGTTRGVLDEFADGKQEA